MMSTLRYYLFYGLSHFKARYREWRTRIPPGEMRRFIGFTPMPFAVHKYVYQSVPPYQSMVVTPIHGMDGKVATRFEVEVTNASKKPISVYVAVIGRCDGTTRHMVCALNRIDK